MKKKSLFLYLALSCLALPVETGHSSPVTAKLAIGIWISVLKQTELFDATECKSSSV